MSWISQNGPERDVAVSSRIRLARNIANMPFPIAMSNEQAQEVNNTVRKSILEGKSVLGRDFSYLPIKDIPYVDREVLVEDHLASKDLMQTPEVSSILINKQETISIMVNEEDHIRMQSILPGFCLNDAWDTLDKVDDCIEEELEYAFDEHLGYLTSCPTNVGTGLRASVMLHLPSLTANKQMNAILQAISKVGLTARGLYGEGSEALGYMYQISNQITLGPSEEDIIENLITTCKQLINRERQTREALKKYNGIHFDDAIWRAYGVLANSRVLELKEFMNLISQVRLGVGMGIINNIGLEDIDKLIILGQNANVVKYVGGSLDKSKTDVERARIVREKFKGLD